MTTLPAAHPPVLPPATGRIVWYALPAYSRRAGESRAAVVTGSAADPGEAGGINLTVLCDRADDFGPPGRPYEMLARATGVRYDPSGRPGTWRWPPA